MDGITNQDVLPESSPVGSEPAKTQEPKAEATEAAKPDAIPGSKTPEANLLAALKEEREQRRHLEERIKQIEASAPSTPEDEVFSDEGKVLKSHISTLESELKKLKEDRELESLYSAHPELRDTASEFSEFRIAYPGVPLDKQAKLFLVEKGLVTTQRKGLERPSGGVKTAPQAEMSEEDLKRLREESPRKYLKLVTEGKI